MSYKKIIALFLCISMSFSFLLVPASATGETHTASYDDQIATAAIDPGLIIGGASIVADLFMWGADKYLDWCEKNPTVDDSEYTGYNPGGSFSGGRGSSRSELAEKAAAEYDNYVSTLPAASYNQHNGFGIYPPFDYLSPIENSDGDPYVNASNAYGSNGFFGFQGYLLASASKNDRYGIFRSEDFTLAPGVYDLVFDDASGSYSNSTSYRIALVANKSEAADATIVFLEGAKPYLPRRTRFSTLDHPDAISFYVTSPLVSSNFKAGNLESGTRAYHLEPVELVDGEVDVTPDASTRPGSISSSFAVNGDNNTVIGTMNGNIVNETTNLYYNPVTDSYNTITNWTYDYSTRSYNLTLDNSTTSTVTYGDEYVTINEGDTIYNISYVTTYEGTCSHNYVVSNVIDATCVKSGNTVYTCSECGAFYSEYIPATGVHVWGEAVVTEATCTETGTSVSTCTLCGSVDTETIPATGAHVYGDPVIVSSTCVVNGSRTSTCTVCGYVERESLATLGHNWTIKQTVQTQYDESGAITQQGYTIFECSVCGEQSRSEDGTAPPSGSTPGGVITNPGGSGGSGSSGGTSIWTQLGELVGTVGGGILGLVESVISALLSALTSLATMIAEKLTQIVDLILSWFEVIPGLFSGFLTFLSAVFPYIPSDAMLLLTFGLAAVVFIGILKALRR